MLSKPFQLRRPLHFSHYPNLSALNIQPSTFSLLPFIFSCPYVIGIQNFLSVTAHPDIANALSANSRSVPIHLLWTFAKPPNVKKWLGRTPFFSTAETSRSVFLFFFFPRPLKFDFFGRVRRAPLCVVRKKTNRCLIIFMVN